MTIVEQIEGHAREIPQKTAVVFHDCKISYRELNETVNRLANAFLGMGLKKGDRVGLMLPRVPELVIGFLAAAKAGGIAVPVSFELTDYDIRTIIEDIRPRFLIVHSSSLELARKAVLSGLEMSVIVVGEGTGKDEFLWSDILRGMSSADPSLKIKDTDVVYLNYTSGSTGASKGALTTHANIYCNTIAAVDAMWLTSNDIHLCMFAPFAHPHELFARPLYLGGTMVLVDKIYPKSIAEAISNHKVTCMMGLAPMYENLLELLEHKHYDLSSLRIPESGGMYTRMDLIERFRQRLGVPIIPVWGSTETTGIALANRPGGKMPHASVGRPCISYQVKIVDEDGMEVSPGETGEMIFKGHAVVQGYYEDEANAQRCFKDGWYYSGDLGKMDEEGNFYFVERKSGMMKVAGLKVYPLEIELALMEHPDIKEAAVIPAKDRLRGEVPKAIIVSKNGKGLTEKEVLIFCRERLPHYKLPRVVEIRESLPKIGSGKINKKILRMECA
ncbi:MAG: AMP-binding protein [Deltaproteobacteria bacterium]|nr:AMP-binding protein [Deltaproteobacteria bacterium]